MLYQERISPLAQLAILFALGGVGIVLSTILTGIIGAFVLHIPLASLSDELMKPENIQAARLLQVLTTFLIMAVPALILANVISRQPMKQLGLDSGGNLVQVLLVAIMVGAGFYVSGALARLNEMIPVSQNAASYFKKLEDQYNEQVMAIGRMDSVADYILSLIVLALVPAMFEEMLFRGSLQQIWIGITKNALTGILITSIIFSAIHVSYYGFLARVFLGIMLGYIFYYSKNLWMSITAHFLNNAYTLTVMFILTRSGKLSEEALNDSYPLHYGLTAGVMLILLFYAFRYASKKVIGEKAVAEEKEEL